MSVAYVVFGATGDLAQRKIMPALCALFAAGKLPEDMEIIAFSRRPWSDGDYRTFIRPALAAHPADVVEQFLSRIRYVAGTFDDRDSIQALGALISGTDAYIHLAIQPEFYQTMIASLGKVGVRATILIEKPFGHDAESAQALVMQCANGGFSNVHAIDHYLGKKGLIDCITRRYTDAQFESRLNAAHVRAITIHCTELLSIAGRGEFYDAVGALRDVGQNHVLTMLASVLMKLPLNHTETSTARTAALAALAPFHIEALGQYDGFLEEEGVHPQSHTETYFHLTTASTNTRWQGVQLSLIAGKACAEKRSDILIEYRDGTTVAFDMDTPKTPDAYETIITAALAHDASYFQHYKEIIAAWKCIDPVVAARAGVSLHVYPQGSRAMLES